MQTRYGQIMLLRLALLVVLAVAIIITTRASLSRQAWPAAVTGLAAAGVLLTNSLSSHAAGAGDFAWLAIAALLLVVGSFIYFAHFTGAPPGSTYVPAHIENGKFVPGQAR